MIRYDKLVRDRIPDIIRADGKQCDVQVLTDEEYARQLDQKLAEELHEYLQNGEVEELVDLVEVVQAIATMRLGSWEAFERKRAQKRDERGGFEGRLLLQVVEE
jgi:predicted house-cleaning noncanonical NTP pyrophosphatase (MazG superfamily)